MFKYLYHRKGKCYEESANSIVGYFYDLTHSRMQTGRN